MSWGRRVIINSFPAQNILGQPLIDDFGDVLFGILEHTDIRKSRKSSILEVCPDWTHIQYLSAGKRSQNALQRDASIRAPR